MQTTEEIFARRLLESMGGDADTMINLGYKVEKVTLFNYCNKKYIHLSKRSKKKRIRKKYQDKLMEHEVERILGDKKHGR